MIDKNVRPAASRSETIYMWNKNAVQFHSGAETKNKHENNPQNKSQASYHRYPY